MDARGSWRPVALAAPLGPCAPLRPPGLSVGGRSDPQLDRARKRVGAAAFTSTAGRSLTLSYMLHPATDLDPAVAAHRSPLIAWAKAVREVSCPRKQL